MRRPSAAASIKEGAARFARRPPPLQIPILLGLLRLLLGPLSGLLLVLLMGLLLRLESGSLLGLMLKLLLGLLGRTMRPSCAQGRFVTP